MTETKICPCGSGNSYEACCGTYINGETSAKTPESLMRSRYTAFCFGENSYLLETWHPETRPESLEDEPNTWVGLTIVDSWSEENEGEVEFIAKLIYDNKLETLHERSNFECIDGKWLYVDGEFINDESGVKKIGKNDECPCGSGKKFKKCHG